MIQNNFLVNSSINIGINVTGIQSYNLFGINYNIVQFRGRQVNLITSLSMILQSSSILYTNIWLATLNLYNFINSIGNVTVKSVFNATPFGVNLCNLNGTVLFI